MGRAYEVRKASIQKTGAAKAKLYSMYAREIYQSAKTGGVSTDSNLTLKHLVERAKKEQVPSDIIKRAIDKVSSGVLENYTSVRYEAFGPGGATLIIEGLTDNVNRILSDIRTALNKTGGKLGNNGSVSYNYDNLAILSFKGTDVEAVIDALIEKDIEVIDVEEDDGNIVVYGLPNSLYQMKEVLLNKYSDINFDIEEITMLPKEKITLSGDDLSNFTKMLSMLEESEDIQNIYHNVNL